MKYYPHIKRILDFVFSLLFIVILFPLLLIVALILIFTSGAPVIFTQKRIGKGGKPFMIYKFRTMKSHAPELPSRDLPDDEYVSRFGRFLRRTGIDELPQLINIIKGDMSIVGPRPLLVEYLPRYNAEQARRHEVRPGLTGYAQVNGRNAITWEEKFRLDVEYVDHISFLQDVKIIFDTAKAVLKREGISAENSATMEEFMGTDGKVA